MSSKEYACRARLERPISISPLMARILERLRGAAAVARHVP